MSLRVKNLKMDLNQRASPNIGNKFFNGGNISFEEQKNHDVNAWINSLNEFFSDHIKSDNAQGVYNLLHHYRRGLSQQVKFFPLSDYLAENIRNYLYKIYFIFETAPIDKIKETPWYLQLMEDVITFYFNLELRILRLTALDTTKNLSVQRRIDYMVWIFVKIAKECLFGNNTSICHVLIRQFFIGDEFTSEVSELWTDEYVKIVMDKLYSHFLLSTHIDTFSEEAFIRYHILLSQWSLMYPNRKTKLNHMCNIFNCPPEIIAQNSKLITDVINVSILDQLLSIHNMYDSKIISTYFKNLPRKRIPYECRLLSQNKEKGYETSQVDILKLYNECLAEISEIETQSANLDLNKPADKLSDELSLLNLLKLQENIDIGAETEALTQDIKDSKQVHHFKTDDLEYTFVTVKKEQLGPPIRRTDIVPSEYIILDDDDDDVEDFSPKSNLNKNSIVNKNDTAIKNNAQLMKPIISVSDTDNDVIILDDEPSEIPTEAIDNSSPPSCSNLEIIDKNNQSEEVNAIPTIECNMTQNEETENIKNNGRLKNVIKVVESEIIKLPDSNTENNDLPLIVNDISSLESEEQNNTDDVDTSKKNDFLINLNEFNKNLNPWDTITVNGKFENRVKISNYNNLHQKSFQEKLNGNLSKQIECEISSLSNTNSILNSNSSEQICVKDSESDVIDERTSSESVHLIRVEEEENNLMDISNVNDNIVSGSEIMKNSETVIDDNYNLEISMKDFNKPSQSHNEELINNEANISVTNEVESSNEINDLDSEVMVQKITTTLGSESDKSPEHSDSNKISISKDLVQIKKYVTKKKHVNTPLTSPISISIKEELTPSKNVVNINEKIEVDYNDVDKQEQAEVFYENSANGKMLNKSKKVKFDESPSTPVNNDDKFDKEVEDFRAFLNDNINSFPNNSVNPSINNPPINNPPVVKSILKKRRIKNTVVVFSKDDLLKHRISIMDPNLCNPEVMRVRLEPIDDSTINTWRLITDRTRKKYGKEGGQTFEKFDYRKNSTELRLSNKIDMELSSEQQNDRSNNTEGYIQVVNATAEDGTTKGNITVRLVLSNLKEISECKIVKLSFYFTTDNPHFSSFKFYFDLQNSLTFYCLLDNMFNLNIKRLKNITQKFKYEDLEVIFYTKLNDIDDNGDSFLNVNSIEDFEENSFSSSESQINVNFEENDTKNKENKDNSKVREDKYGDLLKLNENEKLKINSPGSDCENENDRALTNGFGNLSVLDELEENILNETNHNDNIAIFNKSKNKPLGLLSNNSDFYQYIDKFSIPQNATSTVAEQTGPKRKRLKKELIEDTVLKLENINDVLTPKQEVHSKDNMNDENPDPITEELSCFIQFPKDKKRISLEKKIESKFSKQTEFEIPTVSNDITSTSPVIPILKIDGIEPNILMVDSPALIENIPQSVQIHSDIEISQEPVIVSTHDYNIVNPVNLHTMQSITNYNYAVPHYTAPLITNTLSQIYQISGPQQSNYSQPIIQSDYRPNYQMPMDAHQTFFTDRPQQNIRQYSEPAPAHTQPVLHRNIYNEKHVINHGPDVKIIYVPQNVNSPTLKCSMNTDINIPEVKNDSTIDQKTYVVEHRYSLPIIDSEPNNLQKYPSEMRRFPAEVPKSFSFTSESKEENKPSADLTYQVPIKKRKISDFPVIENPVKLAKRSKGNVPVQGNVETEPREDSYPGTPMLSIADITYTGNRLDYYPPTMVKTKAAKKELPPLVAYDNEKCENKKFQKIPINQACSGCCAKCLRTRKDDSYRCYFNIRTVMDLYQSCGCGCRIHGIQRDVKQT